MRAPAILLGALAITGFTIIIPPPPPTPSCGTPTTNTSNFNGTPIGGGDYIWFNANFSANGIPTSGASLSFTNSTISFKAGGTAYSISVPNADIILSATTTCPSLRFDSSLNTFMETIPAQGSDEIFLTGVAFPVPSGFGSVTDVTWTGTLASSVTGVSMQWKWGAAVYTSFTTEYDQLNIKPMHNGFSNACSNAFNNGDHAGTPEGVNSAGKSWGSFVTGGARGGGGSNLTGSWSGTVNAPAPMCHI